MKKYPDLECCEDTHCLYFKSKQCKIYLEDGRIDFARIRIEPSLEFRRTSKIRKGDMVPFHSIKKKNFVWSKIDSLDYYKDEQVVKWEFKP